LLAVLLAACGDDGHSSLVDASLPDAAPPEETCDGRLEDCPEGGEIRVEYVTFTESNATPRKNGARFTSFFLKNAATGMTPDKFTTLTFGQCNDLGASATATMMWPKAQNAAREYIDVGQTIVYAKTDAAKTVAAMPVPPAKDSIGRTHTGRASFEFGIDDAATWIAGDMPVNVVTTGSATFRPMVFENVTHIPKSFAVTDPLPNTGTINLKEGEARTFKYEVVPANTTEPVGFLLAWVIGGEPRLVCPELQDGEYTMTAADVALLKTYGTTGTLSRQTFVHKIVDLEVEEGVHRRVDAIGVWCYVTPFAIVP
jgi:hypothetical protein